MIVMQIGSYTAPAPPDYGYGIPIASFTASAYETPRNSSVSFTDTSTNKPTQWLWTVNGVQVSTSNTMTYYFSSLGTIPILLYVWNIYSAGTASVAGSAIYVYPPGVPP